MKRGFVGGVVYLAQCFWEGFSQANKTTKKVMGRFPDGFFYLQRGYEKPHREEGGALIFLDEQVALAFLESALRTDIDKYKGLRIKKAKRYLDVGGFLTRSVKDGELIVSTLLLELTTGKREVIKI